MSIELKNIKVTDIVFEDRARQNYKDLDILQADIAEKGVIQPIAVMDMNDGRYKLLAGGRRYSAAVLGGLEEVPARVYAFGLSDLEQREIELMENLSRADFDWKEEVQLKDKIHKLQQEKAGVSVDVPAAGQSLRDTAKLLDVSPMTMSRDMKLAEGLEDHKELLSGAKNKSEALRALKKIDRQKAEQIVIGKMEESLKNDRGAHIKRGMVNGYIVGDFFDRVKRVPDQACSFIEVDPPYAIALDKIKRGAETGTSPGIGAYNEVDTSDYEEFLLNLFTECYRVMGNNTWIVCWFGIQWYSVVLAAMESAGLHVCNLPGIWNKVGHQGQTRNPEFRLGNVYEPFFYARKGDSAIIKTPGRTNCYNYKALHPDHKVHPTERPIEMIQDVIRTFGTPGGHIMVPFMGSGNSLIAASNLGMTGFGYDLSEEYKNAYLKRVMDGQPGEYRSYKE